MTYNELKNTVENAWGDFYNRMCSIGIDLEKLDDRLDSKDCFNDVFDCVMDVAMSQKLLEEE